MKILTKLANAIQINIPAPAANIQDLATSLELAMIPMYNPRKAVRLDAKFSNIAFLTVRPELIKAAKSPAKYNNIYQKHLFRNFLILLNTKYFNQDFLYIAQKCTGH